MYNALASTRTGWRQALLRDDTRAPQVAVAMHAAVDPARTPWAAAVGTPALSAPATDARVPAPRGMPLV